MPECLTLGRRAGLAQVSQDLWGLGCTKYMHNDGGSSMTQKWSSPSWGVQLDPAVKPVWSQKWHTKLGESQIPSPVAAPEGSQSIQRKRCEYCRPGVVASGVPCYFLCFLASAWKQNPVSNNFTTADRGRQGEMGDNRNVDCSEKGSEGEIKTCGGNESRGQKTELWPLPSPPEI